MSTQRTADNTLRIVLVILGIIVLAPLLMMALAFPMVGMWGGGMMGGFGSYGVAPIWIVGMSLVWLVVLVGGGYLVYRWLTGSDGGTADPALDELRLAYARGDLSEEEYEAHRTTLEEE